MSTVQTKQTNLREKLAELLDFRKMRDRLSGLGLYIGKDRTGTDENLLVRGGANVDDLQIGEIAALVGGTAVDVFVYDTSRDSDGGKWRERTQHTSWYNEELNTATRGGRREFPAVAVIVAEADKVTIYDGDDPDLSMWMVFKTWGFGGIPRTCCVALNGKVVVGSSGWGVPQADFIKDTIDHQWNAGVRVPMGGGIINRNIDSRLSSDDSQIIVNSNVNDVAMTILPNAPIDEDTGLPVPTIAVATDGGVSVIKDDGTVVDIVYTNQTIESLWLSQDRIWIAPGNGGLIVGDIPDQDQSSGTASGLSHKINGWNAFANTQETLSTLGSNDTLTYAETFGSDQGLTLIDEQKNDPASSLLSYITSKYNTGWMPGDIKLAALSDSVVENVGVNSDNLLEGNNSSFTSGIGDWVDISIGSESVVRNTSGNYVELTRVDANNNARIGIGLNLQADQMYVLQFSLVDSSSSGVQVRGFKSSDNSFSTNQIINSTASQDGLYTVSFRAEDGYDGIMFIPISGTNTVANLDSVTIRATTELITNGDFSTDSDWTKGTGWSIVGGIASKATSGDSSNLTQEIDCVIGQTYVVSWDITSRDSSAVGFYTLSGGSITSVQNYYESVGSHSEAFTATSESVTIALRAGSTAVLSIDNISVRPAEEDRSVNGNGLQIVGEINKTPVTTGADLVSYSGFSANNYLVQPYNEDLDFGAGDFSIMGWFKSSDISSTSFLLDNSDQDTTTNLNLKARFTVYRESSMLKFYINNQTINSQVQSLALSSDIWYFFTAKRTNGNIVLYVNGEHVDTGSDNSINLTNTNSTLAIGANWNRSTAATTDDVCLLRISATAPTPEQIAKIYRDEKPLFTDGAQSTLYGTSDAVTALAYDQKTELLHVGTASGRSDFSGLSRVHQTNSPVTTCIDAEDGLIAEN